MAGRLTSATVANMLLIWKIKPLLALVALYVSVRIGPANGYITYIEARLPLKGSRSPPGSPWPMPQVYRPGNKMLQVEPTSFMMKSNAMSCDIVSKAVRRYQDMLFLHSPTSTLGDLPSLTTLQIDVEKYKDKDRDCGYPRHKDNETYTLKVDGSGLAKLRSETVWGALRGLETFSHLVFFNETSRMYLINETSIEDWPRFPFRAVLLDTARHFQPMKVLKQNLDAMAMSKFNVFHWHLVDDQSWPYEMTVYPNLTAAAYHPSQIYSRRDVIELVEYARERGIRVIPEIDTPGHTQALGKVFPDLLTACYGEGGRGTARYPDFTGYEMLNPMRDYTYDVLRNIFNETFHTFPDDYLHLGMDEVYYKCWDSSPEVKEFMKKHGLQKVSEVEQYYVKKTLNNIKKLGAKYMIWQDPIDNGVKAAPDTLVGVWKDVYLDSKLRPWQDYMKSIVKHGYELVLSAPWYLNYISYGQDWRKYYEVDPLGFDASDDEKKLVIGGEACMWGEYVDATNLISRLWPRACAVAERLWSAPQTPTTPPDATDSAAFRLDEMRCRLVRRRIPAAPILNGFCGRYDWDVAVDPTAPAAA